MGLTLEPALLGLLVAPSVAGLLLGVGALLAFLIRSPLSFSVCSISAVVAGFRELAASQHGSWPSSRCNCRHRRHGDRCSGLAMVDPSHRGDPARRRPALVRRAEPRPWHRACSCAARSVCARWPPRSVIAGGESGPVAAALWTALPLRDRCDPLRAHPDRAPAECRRRGSEVDVRGAGLAQGAAATCAALAVAVDASVWLGFAGVLVLSLLQVTSLRRPPLPAKVLGMRQMVFGLALVALTVMVSVL